MTINGTVRGTITAQQASFDKVKIDEIEIDANRLSTTNSNADLQLDLSGTGSVNIKDSFYIQGNSFTNIGNNAVTSISSTGSGYVRFNGTGAIQIPSGTTAEQILTAPVGTIRYNIDDTTGEVFDGNVYIPMAGNSSGISANDMQDLADFWILILA